MIMHMQALPCEADFRTKTIVRLITSKSHDVCVLVSTHVMTNCQHRTALKTPRGSLW